MEKDAIEFNLTERISHLIMMNSFFIVDPGLYHGQMGIAVAMSKLYKHTENKVFLDFSYDLLDLVFTKVSNQLPFSLSSGLAGIGWGIEYFIQNNFVVGNSIEICEEIDHKIMETDPRRITDLSLDSGFEGLLHYILFHIQGAVKQNTQLPFDNKYLTDIYYICYMLSGKKISQSLRKMTKTFTFFIEEEIFNGYHVFPTDYISNLSEISKNNLESYPLGFSNGLSGFLFQTMEKRKI